MKIYQQTLEIETESRVTYKNITEEVKKGSGWFSSKKTAFAWYKQRIQPVQCYFEEYVHDHDFNGDEFLQADLNRILDKLVPREFTENSNYRYPGPKHVQFLKELAEKNPDYPADPRDYFKWWCSYSRLTIWW